MGMTKQITLKISEKEFNDIANYANSLGVSKQELIRATALHFFDNSEMYSLERYLECVRADQRKRVKR